MWGLKKEAAHYRSLAGKLRREIRRTLWDDREQAFIDGLKKGRRVGRISRFAQVWAILFDLVSKKEAARLARRILEGDLYPPPSYSINHQWEFLACIKAGMTQSVLEVLRSVWGKMLELGPGTFWEDFIPGQKYPDYLSFYGRPYAKSLCHGFSGAIPLAVLSEGLLGVKAASPGFAQAVISPKLAGLRWMRGSVPTPHGPIELELDAGGLGKVKLPAGVSARIVSEEGKPVAQFKRAGTFKFKFC